MLRRKYSSDRKSVNYKINNIILCVCVVVIVVLINMIVNTIGIKHSLKIDLTKSKIFQLSPATKQLLNSLEKPVTIYYMPETGNESPYTREVIEKYAKTSKMISIKTVDPIRDPVFAQKYSMNGNRITKGSLIVESGEKFRLIDPGAMFEITYNNQQHAPQATDFKLEEKITNAIAYVTAQKNTTVYYTQGHGEAYFSDVQTVIEGENIKVKPINLINEDIPQDTDMVIIFGPQVDFGAGEINRLDTYFNKGGRVWLGINPGISTERLEKYVYDWGITFDNNIITENDNKKVILDNQLYILGEIKSHDITDNILEKNLNILIPVTRSISTIATKNVISIPLVTASKQSESHMLLDKNIGYKVRNGPFNLVVISQKEIPKTRSAILLVSGTTQYIFPSDSALKNIITAPNLSNREFFLRSIKWMTDSERNMLNILPKSLRVDNLLINDSQKFILVMVFSVLLPLIVLGMGLIVWFRRRNI